jgi:SRSO17 transposase
MTIEELEAWQDELEQFHARFADLFERSESREQAKKYLRGLLAQADRKNSWQVAEVVGDRVPDRMQRLLYRVPWDGQAARDRLQQFVIETFGDEEGIGVVDETSFLKKGTHSVGVARQDLGAAGKVENGQVATVLSYAARHAHVFLDRRLYLPEEWIWEKQRRAAARVPGDVRFETKPEQAIVMLEHAWEQGVPMRWVRGDEVYGDSPRLRETIQEHGRFYVLAVSANTRVWTERPEVEEPQEQTGGRPRRVRRLAKGETGLDEYEVRFWHSWYRHITLSMMAHAWLASIRLREREKKVRKRMSLPG